jgi:hypothetical protein
MKLFTFTEFVNEGSVKVGEVNDVVIDDMTTYDGTEISAEEILGMVVANKTEDDMVDSVYKKYGQMAFSKEDISNLQKAWNDYNADKKEAELEAEKEKEGAGEKGSDATEGGGDTDAAMKELGI